MARCLHTQGGHTTCDEDAQEHDDQKQERKLSTASSLVMQPYPESAPMITHCGILANANALTAIRLVENPVAKITRPFFQCRRDKAFGLRRTGSQCGLTKK